jgi:hypothetical protein
MIGVELLCVNSARASVVTNLSDSGPGSLPSAIISAAPGDTIQFAPGLMGSILLQSALPTITANLTIDGGSKITINGNNSVADFVIGNGAAVTLNGVTITGGHTSNDGGGIYNGGMLTVVNSTIAGNAASNDGGGIYNGGVLTVVNVNFVGNTASNGDGGGIYNGGVLTVVNVNFVGNTASNGDGGGIYNNGGVIDLTNSTFLNNFASFGSDIYNNGGTITETPLPAAFSLFATGIGGLGLLGWRRKRKAQAVAA